MIIYTKGNLSSIHPLEQGYGRFAAILPDMLSLKIILVSCLPMGMPTRIRSLEAQIRTLPYWYHIHFQSLLISRTNMRTKYHVLQTALSNGGLIVQKYGDILKGRRSTDRRIKEGFIEPTLKEAVPGDLGLVLPYNTLKSLIEMTEALNQITPGLASEHTLFYGVEAKFYSARPKLNDRFESEISGLYVGGDGAGITRGLSPSKCLRRLDCKGYHPKNINRT